jgi:hypothetical protein
MSSLWIERPARQWQSRALVTGRLQAGDELGLPGIGLLALRQGAALFVRDGVRVRVNGEPIVGGLRLLEHRDELLTEAGRCVFSGQSAPVVTAFALAGGERVPTCPVCRGPVRDGMTAVLCPGCGRWAHQSDTRPCWLYAPACRFCNHPTSFAGEAAWRPDHEEDHG